MTPMPTAKPTRRSLIPLPVSTSRYQHPLVGILRRYAKVFGDFEEPLLRCANDIHRRATIDDVKMYEAIEEAIQKKGCHTVEDLTDELRLPESEVKRIYSELLFDPRYEERPVKKAAPGRREQGIFLKREPPGNLPPGTLRDDRRVYGQYTNADPLTDEDEF